MGDRGADIVDFQALRRRLDEAERALSAEQVDPERRRAILEQRARALAGERERAAEESVPVVAFTVGGDRYALRIEEVSQTLDAEGVWPLLGAPRWLLGAVAARASVIPVLDLRQLLGLEGGGVNDLTRVVVVTHQGESFGIAAEQVEGRVDAPVAATAEPGTGPFRWVADDGLALLDLEKLVARPPGQG